MEKNDRNLKNILWNHAIRTTTLPTPKFRLTSVLRTHATHAKGSAHATHTIFLTHAKILQAHAANATHAKVWPMPPTYHAQTLPTQPTLPTPHTHPRYPYHPRYLADSSCPRCFLTYLVISFKKRAINSWAIFSLRIACQYLKSYCHFDN